MNLDKFLASILRFSGIKLVSIVFKILETIFCLYFYKILKRGKKINSKIFGFLQLFSDGRLYTLYRRKTHDELIKKLDPNLNEDQKVIEISQKSYSKIFELSKAESQETVDYFYKQKIYDSHVPFNTDFPNKLINVDDFLKSKDCHYGSFDIKTSLNSNVVKKVCNMESLWNIVKKYLNTENVHIYTINTMLTKKSEVKKDYVINMHKDQDCASSLTVFIYWTEVSKLNGATKVLPGDHLFQHDRKVRRYVSEKSVNYLEGQEGSLFAVDTWAMHAGNPNIKSPRLVTWIRFSSMPARTYYLDSNYFYKKELESINKKFIL